MFLKIFIFSFIFFCYGVLWEVVFRQLFRLINYFIKYILSIQFVLGILVGVEDINKLQFFFFKDMVQQKRQIFVVQNNINNDVGMY